VGSLLDYCICAQTDHGEFKVNVEITMEFHGALLVYRVLTTGSVRIIPTISTRIDEVQVHSIKPSVATSHVSLPDPVALSAMYT